MRNSPSSPTEAEPAHSPLGPSGSKRWLHCRASVGFIEKHKGELPIGKGSKAADEGTEAHLFAERLLLGDKKVERPRSTEMVACIEEGYVPFVRAEAKRVGLKRVPPEMRVPLFYDRSQKGTCDAPLLGEQMIIIADLKYGFEIVQAKFNTQLAIYAESTIREVEAIRGKYPKSTPCELIIYQPRSPDNKFVKRWCLTRGELAEFCGPIMEAAHSIIMDPDDQPFHADADTTCKYCAAKAICAHYAAHLLEEVPPPVAKQLKSVEARLNLPKPNKLRDGDLVRLIQNRADLMEWFDACEAYLTNKMLAGSKFEGIKVVASKTNRKWTDERAAMKLLQEEFDKHDLFEQKFVSPAGAGELIKTLKKPDPRFLDRVAKLITKPEGEPRLAPKDDPRPPLEIDPLADLRNELL
jgi:hypothetical protein